MRIPVSYTHLDVYKRQGVYGLEQIPANMIERVEVLRGGGSALFGSSAIGGTINVITKEPSRNSAQMSHTLTSVSYTHLP